MFAIQYVGHQKTYLHLTSLEALLFVFTLNTFISFTSFNVLSDGILVFWYLQILLV